jgi:hypothetical protein
LKVLIIIVVLMNVIACSTQPTNDYQSKSTLETTTKNSHSQDFKAIVPIGTWEGISRLGAEFKVLKIMSNNQHSLTSYNIASGMQFHKSVSFTNNDIECDKFNCHIYTHTADEKLPLKITLTKFVDQDYLVTEAVRLTSEGIYSTSYGLKTVKTKTTPERFIAQEAEKLTAIASIHKNERFGYWSGVLEISNEDQLKLATLDYQPGKVATFTVYTPGSSYQAKMTFNPKWLRQSNGELTTKLKGAFFASEMTLRYSLRDVIEGDFEQRFERYPERLMGHGNFRLSRVKPSEDYKLPKWLKPLLQKLE